MKVCMINDCAYVGETLLRYFPEGIETKHIKRTRGMWNKTFGIAWKILRAKADLYHVHYALQDAYITLKTKKEPVIVHAHGSDVRSSRKHKVWGRIVRYNLKNCEKTFVSTPDILNTALEYNETSEYLPNPIDLKFFPLAPFMPKNFFHVFYPADMSTVKGTSRFVEGFAKFQEGNPESRLTMIDYGKDREAIKQLLKNLSIKNLTLLPLQRHAQMREKYLDADVVCTDFNLGVAVMTTLEAMACGRPVIQFIEETFYQKFTIPPVHNAKTPEEIAEGLEYFMDVNKRKKWVEKQSEYIHEVHDPKKIVKRIMEIYEEAL